MTTNRSTNVSVDPIFLHRWSPRSFDGTPMPQSDLRTILEAARWAPSAFNYQPWRILYATRDDSSEWQRFMDLLLPFNAMWACEASVLMYILSDTTMGEAEKLNASHSFDAGAAWSGIAHQAHLLGYHAHAMAGFDAEKTRTELAIPAHIHINAAVAIGRRGAVENLPEKLQAREVPSERKPLDNIAYAGNFRAV